MDPFVAPSTTRYFSANEGKAEAIKRVLKPRQFSIKWRYLQQKRFLLKGTNRKIFYSTWKT
jgi:hypothetical protein